MTKTVQHISLKKSTIKDKAPLAKDLVDGELAVNIAKDGEKIFLKNTENNIVGFSSDKLLDTKYLSTTSGGTVSGDTEFKGDVKIVYPDSTSQTVSLRELMVGNEKALNDLSERVNNQKTKEYLPLSGGTVSGDTTFNKDVKVVFPNSETPTSLVSAIVNNEKVTAAALNDLNEKFDNYLPSSGGTLNGQLIVHDLYIYGPDGVKYKFDVDGLLSGDCITRV